MIRDNDKDFKKYCVDNYSNCVGDSIKIFYDNNNDVYTFEVSIYNKNKAICDKLFNSDAQSYMLKNKTETAFRLLDKKADEIVTPEYIEKAIEWISE